MSSGQRQLTINAAADGATLVGLPVHRPATLRGVVHGFVLSAGGTRTVLTFPTALFTAGQFDTPGQNHFVEFFGGAAQGLISDVVVTSANSLELADDFNAVLSAGVTTFVLRPNWTVGTVLGDYNSVGLIGGTSAASADNVQIQVGSDSPSEAIYYHTANQRWQTASGAVATNWNIPPDGGLVVTRVSGASAVVFHLVGESKVGTSLVNVAAGGASSSTTTVAPNPYPVSLKRLADLGL